MSTTQQWTQFFRDSGLPETVAFEYGVIFSDNRMKDDMLGDLNKVSPCKLKNNKSRNPSTQSTRTGMTGLAEQTEK
jgi:hypothetical protein